MSKGSLFIGIDTSCYTTSVAAYTDNTILHIKKPLKVKDGQCGLRQSEAVFQHVKNLPLCFDELKSQINFRDFEDISVTASSRPRNVEGSYMPVFVAGQSFAKTISDVLGARYFETSHQEGHIMAAIHSCHKYSIMSKPFLSYHLSGGTGELLLVTPKGTGFDCEIVGGVLDLPAGQFIDRIGVKLGMEFPCGKYMDYSAVEYSGEKPNVKSCVKGTYINFSGEETRYERLIEAGENPDLVAYSVMKCISQSVKKSVEAAKQEYSIENVIMAGGVASSRFLRSEFSEIPGIYFAEAELSTDNAVGVCLLGKEMSDI